MQHLAGVPQLSGRLGNAEIERRKHVLAQRRTVFSPVQSPDEVLAGLFLLLGIALLDPGAKKVNDLASGVFGRLVLVQHAEGQRNWRHSLALGLVLKALFEVWRVRSGGVSYHSAGPSGVSHTDEPGYRGRRPTR